MRSNGMLTPTGGGLRRALFVITVLASVLLLISPAALAKATKTDVEFQTNVVEDQPPERFWTTSGGAHIRGQPFEGDVTGDLIGTISGETNANIVFATGHATFFGTFVLETDKGTWEGSFRGIGTPSEGAAGTLVGQGDDGTKLKGTFEATGPGELVFQATILDPHG